MQATVAKSNTTLQRPQVQQSERVKAIYEYVLVLWNGVFDEICESDRTYIQVPDRTETIFPVFDHEPTQADWDEYLKGWKSAGFRPLTNPCSINRNDTEF